MKLSIQVPNYTWPGGPQAMGPTLARIGKAADDAGLDTVWVMDHFLQLEYLGPPDAPMLEGYTTLAYLAGVTERVRLGTLVSGAFYRPPGLLAKIVTTLDVLSGGRAWLGIGAGWFELEGHALGFGFPSVKERFDRLEDALELIRRGWNGDRSHFEGRTVTATGPILSPAPITSPHPPILIGGGGEKRALGLVARYADAWNFFAYRGIDEAVRKSAILDQRCAEIGRDPNEIERTLLAGYNGRDPNELVERCRTMAAAGFSHLILNVADDHTITPVEQLREVVGRVAEL